MLVLSKINVKNALVLPQLITQICVLIILHIIIIYHISKLIVQISFPCSLLNASVCSGPQMKGTPLQVSCQRSSLISAILGENFERKLHIPRKRCSSVTEVGVVISVMALTLSGIGLCPLTV